MKKIAVGLALLFGSGMPLPAGGYYFGPVGPVSEASSAVAELLPYQAPDPALTLADESVRYLGEGAYSITRIIVNKGADTVSFNDVLKVRDLFMAGRFTIPCVNYDGNDFDGGNVLYNGFQLGAVKVPTGIRCEGQTWLYSYQRTGIPSCTLTENAETGLALFASAVSSESLVSSCGLEQDEEGRYVHLIVRPVVEAPYTYEAKGVFGPRYDEKIILAPGEHFTATSYLCVCPPKFENYGSISLLEQAARLLNPQLEICMDDEEAWALAQRYVRSLLYLYNGHWLTATNRKQRMFSVQHKVLISREEMARMQRWEYWTDIATFLPGFELGWAGHNFMNGRMMAVQALKTGDDELLEKAVGIFDAWVKTQRKNGLLFVRFQQNDEKGAEKKYFPDVCNLGWGAQEAVRMYRLLGEYAIDKPEYLEFARRLCEFFIQNWNDDYGFGKSWKLNGKPAQSKGSIGGFLIPAMLEMYEVTADQKYFDMAVKASDFYYTRDLDRFVCTAGAIDCNCVDKETAYPFLQSSLQLYRLTKDEKYLVRAEKAAAYFASWMFFYDPVYGPETDFSRYNWHATGGTAVSAEHHTIDAWGGIMAPDLYVLSELTGNPLWYRFGCLMWANAVQGITRKLGDFVHDTQRPIGAQNEAFSQARYSKYRPDITPGYWNDLLVVWPQSYRLWTLDRMHKMGVRLR